MYHGYGDTPLPSVDAILMALLNCDSRPSTCARAVLSCLKTAIKSRHLFSGIDLFYIRTPEGQTIKKNVT